MISDNIAIACGNNHGAADLKIYEKDPGFVNLAAMNLALRKDTSVYADIDRFTSIPFHKIGLYVNEMRPKLPTYRHELKDWQPTESVPGYDVLDRQ